MKEKQLDQLSNQQAALSRKLDNQQFIAKAPAAVVSKVKQEFSDIASEIKSIETQIATFNTSSRHIIFEHKLNTRR